MEQTEKVIFAPVIIRRSVIILFSKLVLLESVFILIFLLLRIPVHLYPTNNLDFDFDNVFIAYTTIYIILALVKFSIMMGVILMWMNDYYEVIPGTLIHKKGVFSTTSSTFSLGNIEMQEVKQGILAKLFHYGTIEIFNPLLKQTFWLVNVPYPHKQLKAIQHHSHQNQQDTKIIPLT